MLSPARTVAALCFLTSGAARAAEYEWVGKWDCGAAVFTFTNRTWHNGDKLLRFKSIEFGAKDVKLSFPDAYVIALQMNGRDRMTWLSLVSGDTFSCKRKK